VLTPPDGAPEDLLVAALGRGWDLDVASIRYLTVGFGSHHWVVADVPGARWFVTVDDLAERRHSQGDA
jgi:spectinomycin phosphotransferase